LQRRESRGSHWRGDYPQADERLTRVHYVLQPMPVHAPATQLLQEVAPHA